MLEPPPSDRTGTPPVHTIRRLVVGPRRPDNHAVADESSEKFLIHLRAAMGDGSLTRLTLGSHRGADPTLRRLVVRPVVLQAGPRFAFVWSHATRDITKNFTGDEALALVTGLVGTGFATAHLATTTATVQFEQRPGRPGRIHVGPALKETAATATAHDRTKKRSVDTGSAWLRGLGVTAEDGKVRKGMEAKFRQVHRFVELLGPLIAEAPLPTDRPWMLVDMGCGKGYLTFAAHAHLAHAAAGPARVLGIEARADLVELCNRVARDTGATGLEFTAGTIAGSALEQVDVLVALHACDTATDDALAKGIAAGAALLVVAPCCHREVRPQMVAPEVLEEPLRHGILRERQAEFATDALRAAILEWAGYSTSVFEFISPEHTGKNLMISAVKRTRPADPAEAARKVRALAAFYGIRHQTLAARLGFDLSPVSRG